MKGECMIVFVYKGRYCNGKISRSTCHVSVFRGQRQITEQNSTHACLTCTIPNSIIFDKMKDKLVVNSITEFDRYLSGNSRVTADLLSDLTVLIRGFFQRQITEHNQSHACLAGPIPNFIIFDRMKDILVVNSMTESVRYWSGNSRVTADFTS